MQFHICLLSLALILFSTKNVSSENDFKKEFGQKVGAALKVEGIQLFKAGIKSMEEFYDTLLEKTSPSAEEITDLNKRKNKLQELSTSIENMKSKDLVKEIETFFTKHVLNMASFKEKAEKNNDVKKIELIAKAVETSSNKIREAGKKFSVDICDMWIDLFKTIPQNELDKFPEYQQINEYVQELKKVPGGGAELFKVLKSLIQFFEYNDWAFLLQIENQMKL